MDYTRVAESEVQVGTFIYDVYAIDRPECKEIKIGTIQTISYFQNSEFGDRKLFFRHVYPTKDFDQEHDWATYRDYWSAFKKIPGKKVEDKIECPFKWLYNRSDD
jgi:hypothetical protein